MVSGREVTALRFFFFYLSHIQSCGLLKSLSAGENKDLTVWANSFILNLSLNSLSEQRQGNMSLEGIALLQFRAKYNLVGHVTD